MRVFLADVFNGNVVQNDIRFAVMEAFAEAGIAIPSTVRAMPPEHEDGAMGDPAIVPPAAVESVRKSRRKPDPD